MGTRLSDVCRTLAIAVAVCAWIPTLPCVAASTENSIDLESLKAPPRNIEDVLKALDPAKQDYSQIGQARQVLALPRPDESDLDRLRDFYYRRSSAHVLLGDYRSAYDDFLTLVERYPNSGARFTQDLVDLANAEMRIGNPSAALRTYKRAHSTVSTTNRGALVSIARQELQVYLYLGDLDNARKLLDEIEGHVKQLSNGKADFFKKQSFVSQLEWGRGKLLLRTGRPLEAERALRQAAKIVRELASTAKDARPIDSEQRTSDSNAGFASLQYRRLSLIELDLSAAYLNQRRFIDAEVAAREGIDIAIAHFGVTSPDVAQGLSQLSQIISEQGRRAEAVMLSNASIKLLQQAGAQPASIRMIQARKTLASALVADNKFDVADKVYSELERDVNVDPETYALYRPDDLSWILAMIQIGKAEQATAMAGDLLTRHARHLDKNSATLAYTRGMYAASLQASGKLDQANTEYKAAVPVLIDQAQLDSENSGSGVIQQHYLTFVLGSYLALLAQTARDNPGGAQEAAATAFLVADVARGSGVQRALTASAARANIKDPELAKLARQEQDIQRRIAALSDLLTGLLSAAPQQQLPEVQSRITTEIESLKAQRQKERKTLESRFPGYAELVDPKPPTIDRVRKLLKSDEVLLSWYFTDKAGYVWAVTRDDSPIFGAVPVDSQQIANEVTQLRKALDPGASTIEQIPAFDVTLANKLYQQIVMPVETSIKGKRLILAVPHAELGQLPLSLLVTQPVRQPVKTSTPFAEYRSVPWLIRNIAIEQLPSVTSLAALRSLREGDPGRKNFVGFGDPYFSRNQMLSSQKVTSVKMASRGVPVQLRSAPKTSGVSSAEIALLPRLPPRWPG
ncbi:MAG: hypothetical protein WCP99_20320 [Burkholderiales bacterium]